MSGGLGLAQIHEEGDTKEPTPGPVCQNVWGIAELNSSVWLEKIVNDKCKAGAIRMNHPCSLAPCPVQRMLNAVDRSISRLQLFIPLLQTSPLPMRQPYDWSSYALRSEIRCQEAFRPIRRKEHAFTRAGESPRCYGV